MCFKINGLVVATNIVSLGFVPHPNLLLTTKSRSLFKAGTIELSRLAISHM